MYVARGRRGSELPSAPSTVAQATVTPLVRFGCEVPGGKVRLAPTAMRTVHGLLKWAAQLNCEPGRGVGTILSPTSRDA